MFSFFKKFLSPGSPPAETGALDPTGLRKTGASLTSVFAGTRIDETLYEELESALLMADAGVAATEHLLGELKQRVKRSGVSEPSALKDLLADALADLLKPLEQPLVIGQHQPTVIMVAGVNRQADPPSG
jgi:fused signal recognition particle receptor